MMNDRAKKNTTNPAPTKEIFLATLSTQLTRTASKIKSSQSDDKILMKVVLLLTTMTVVRQTVRPSLCHVFLLSPKQTASKNNIINTVVELKKDRNQLTKDKK